MEFMKEKDDSLYICEHIYISDTLHCIYTSELPSDIISVQPEEFLLAFHIVVFLVTYLSFHRYENFSLSFWSIF